MNLEIEEDNKELIENHYFDFVQDSNKKIKEEVKVRNENNKIEPIKSNEHINIPKKKSKEQTK